jgi:DNA end-binding protein Ku
MAARAIWQGALELGRSRLPVKLYSAVEDQGIHFHLLEKSGHTRVKQHMVSRDTGRGVPNEEIRKGYEVEPDTFVIIDDEDLERLEPEPSDAIEIPHFVPRGRIGSQYYDRPYYLGADGDPKAYFALAEAMERKEREGFARWVMRKKHHIGALCARDGYLVLITLRYAGEVVSARELKPPPGKPPDSREVKMAEQLVQTLEGDFRPEDYSDEYRERVMSYIEAKAKGHKPKLQTIRAPRETKSLMDALTASLKSASKLKEKAVA